ncbi:hypothetical protein [Mycolicibacterium hippocampi]|uniref:Helix-turn-helix domain-containing protein n=1 Tax=Mycolicibacterium hippocampi TaxID=659824 RepID=A0A7I9ZQ16_9MYCO|nr:hypothetical protein [Mycolicibacterium hippocampi]GFH02797.1 hypothetical protein MHIP_32800 [Mycolicibacterium hippocampi]
MNLSEDETQAALYCVTELVDRRRRAGVPVPNWMTKLGMRLKLASLMSPSGHESGCSETESEADRLIGTSEAATILQMTERHTRRIASDLDGEYIAGRLVFNLFTVTEYAQEKRNGRSGRSIRAAS